MRHCNPTFNIDDDVDFILAFRAASQRFAPHRSAPLRAASHRNSTQRFYFGILPRNSVRCYASQLHAAQRNEFI